MIIHGKKLVLAASALLSLYLLFAGLACAENGDHANPGFKDSMAPDGTIPPGTKVTLSNWRQYKRFMPDGMIELFNGSSYWKMPPDVQIEVGPLIIHPLPETYRDATAKYASQVKVVELTEGRLSMEGYRGGIPFPNPAEPHKGWKILA